MAFANLFAFFLIALLISSSNANSIRGCGGFVEASTGLIKARNASDAKLDYSHVTLSFAMLWLLYRNCLVSQKKVFTWTLGQAITRKQKLITQDFFHLRGLIRDTTYLLKVVSKDGIGVVGIERASPESLSIQVESDDIKGANFIVFEQPEATILSVHVEGAGLELLQPHLSVEVKSVDDTSKIEAVFPLPLAYYFQIRDLPKGKHLVQLRSGLPSNTHRFESEIIEVDLENHPQIHVGPMI